MENKNVSLVATWWVKDKYRYEIKCALKNFVTKILKEEPETLIYRVHFPRFDYPKPHKSKKSIKSHPKPDRNAIYFFEKYSNWKAFENHLNGEIFKDFISQNQHMFVKNKKGKPKIKVVFLNELIGFNR